MKFLGGDIEALWTGGQTGSTALPAYADPMIRLAECVLFCIKRDPRLAQHKRRNLEYRMRTHHIKGVLRVSLSADKRKVINLQMWEDAWHAELARQDVNDMLSAESPLLRCIKIAYSAPQEVVEWIWDEIGDNGFDKPENLDIERMIKLVKRGVDRAHQGYTQLSPSIGWEWGAKANDKDSKDRGKKGGRGNRDLNNQEQDGDADGDSRGGKQASADQQATNFLNHVDASIFALYQPGKGKGGKGKGKGAGGKGSGKGKSKWKQPDGRTDKPDSLAVGPWDQPSCCPCTTTTSSNLCCTDPDCMKHVTEFYKLNKSQGFRQMSLFTFNHNETACPFAIAKATGLDQADGIDGVSHAAAVIRRIHGKLLRSSPFGKDSDYNNLRDPVVREALRKSQKESKLHEKHHASAASG
eukprot:SAG31_NODE_618_length_13513_cov_87.043164_10_plen_411_part_00